MKLKTATLIAAIFEILQTVLSIYSYIEIVSTSTGIDNREYIYTGFIYSLSSASMALFLFVLYSKQK